MFDYIEKCILSAAVSDKDGFAQVVAYVSRGHVNV